MGTLLLETGGFLPSFIFNLQARQNAEVGNLLNEHVKKSEDLYANKTLKIGQKRKQFVKAEQANASKDLLLPVL